MPTVLRSGVHRLPGDWWQAVMRAGARAIVWACPHSHDSPADARECADDKLEATLDQLRKGT